VGIVANWNNADVELWSHVDVESAAVAAVAALGLAYGAVDLVEHEGRWGVLEVNCWPRDLEVMGRIGGLDALGRVVALLG
jgi:glutathione synthase/RimK-type ligase-like ATP-grasp enzyme